MATDSPTNTSADTSADTIGLAPRLLAWRVLQAVAGGAHADGALERQLQQQPLPAGDRGLATELAYGTIRQQRLLDAWIDGFGRLPAARQPPKLRWVLQLGLYQLLFSHRIPPSAALHTSVGLARAVGLERLAPVVNGLLRSVQRRRLALGIGVHDPWDGLSLPDDPVTAFGVRHSLPSWLAGALHGWLEPSRAEAFARACNATPSLDLRVNPLRTSRDAQLHAFAAAGISAVPIDTTPHGIELIDRRGDLRALPGYSEGHWCVQDRSAMRIAPLLAPRPGERILDACAAPGGKSTHLAELMGDNGEIWAADLQDARLGRLRANAERLGLASIQPLVADSTDPANAALRERAPFDHILVDAPCSGLGTLARHADARWRINPERIPELVALQRRLLSTLAPLLRPGGRMVYATCTVHPHENAEVVAAFLADHPLWQAGEHWQRWPGEAGGGDGFYAAVLTAPSP